MEGGKQVVREKVIIGNFDTKELSAIMERTKAMHASMQAFMEANFGSYIYLVVLDFVGMCHLCRDSNAKGNQLAGSSPNVRPSSNTPRN